jgi:hypothetical protein
MSQAIQSTQPIIDIYDYDHVPRISQYHIYRGMMNTIGRSFYNTQNKLQECYKRRSKLAVGDVSIEDLDKKIERYTRHLNEYGRYNRIIGEYMNLEDDLIGILGPMRIYCDAHMTQYYLITDSKKYIELQNKYKTYMSIRDYIKSKIRYI